MSRQQNIAYLQADRGNLQRQLTALGDRPSLKRRGLMHRLEEVNRELERVTNEDSYFASGELTFNGNSVIGTTAIKASFAAKALAEFEHTVSVTAATLDRTTAINTRGLVSGQREQQLFITDIARGSFGFRLEERTEQSPASQTTLAAKSDLSQALELILELIEAGSDASDERFAEAILRTNDRVRSALRSFAEVLVRNETTCALTTGGKRFRFAEIQQVEKLLNRLAEENVRQERVTLTGMLFTLPTGHRFELRDDLGEVWSGRADSSLEVDTLANFAHQRVTIEAEKSVIGGQGQQTKKLLLLNIRPVASSS